MDFQIITTCSYPGHADRVTRSTNPHVAIPFSHQHNILFLLMNNFAQTLATFSYFTKKSSNFYWSRSIFRTLHHPGALLGPPPNSASKLASNTLLTEDGFDTAHPSTPNPNVAAHRSYRFFFRAAPSAASFLCLGKEHSCAPKPWSIKSTKRNQCWPDSKRETDRRGQIPPKSEGNKTQGSSERGNRPGDTGDSPATSRRDGAHISPPLFLAALS